MAAKIRLSYFAARGLGEVPRLILYYAGEKFEDNRVDWMDFPKLKAKIPNGQLPLLEVEGKSLPQAGAIARYLARRFHLNGVDEFEAAVADSVYCFFYDQNRAQLSYTMFRLGVTPEADGEKLYREVFIPMTEKALPYYRKLLNTHPNGLILSSGISYADFAVADQLTTIFGLDPKLEADWADLVKFRDRIHSLPQLAGYLKTRPDTLI